MANPSVAGRDCLMLGGRELSKHSSTPSNLIADWTFAQDAISGTHECVGECDHQGETIERATLATTRTTRARARTHAHTHTHTNTNTHTLHTHHTAKTFISHASQHHSEHERNKRKAESRRTMDGITKALSAAAPLECLRSPMASPRRSNMSRRWLRSAAAVSW
jgi:hypothetical protein